MIRIRYATDIEECERAWRQAIPVETIWDIWEVRECFDRHYRRSRLFIIAEDRHRIVGLLPLSRLETDNDFGYFPGETWNGKTWIEQNRIVAQDEIILRMMLDHCPGNYHLRYLTDSGVMNTASLPVDETGYLFYPSRYDFNIESYYNEFSHKSLKRILKSASALITRGAKFRFDDMADFDALVSLNLSRYETRSYFHDMRFRESFREVAQFLQNNGWLRITTVTIDGRPVAVDIGSTFNGTYALLAGGTDGEFPGIAKLINLRHIEWACEQKFKEVDFLCGEFSWKPMFHLSPRQLFLLSGKSAVLRKAKTVSRRMTHAG